MLRPELWQPIELTLKLATVTTALLLVIGTPIAWWLAHTQSRIKEVVSTVVPLPLVLPPTVLGFYLLIALGPQGVGGLFGDYVGVRTFAFTFSGLVFGSIIYSMPFVVQPLRNAFEAQVRRQYVVVASVRYNPLTRIMHMALPHYHT